MSFRIFVCVKPVPDPTYWGRMKLDAVTRTLTREGIPAIINPLDKCALEMGIRLRESWGGHVTVLGMAPLNTRHVFLDALAMGADEGILLSDSCFRGSDSLITAKILAAGIRFAGGADFVLTGQQSIDGGTGQVAPQLAQFLDMPNVGHIREIKSVKPGLLHVRSGPFENQTLMEVNLPAVLSVLKEVCTPRFISMMGILQAESKQIRIFSAEDIKLDKNQLGLNGSPTQVSEIFTPNVKRRREILKGDSKIIVQDLLQKLRKNGYPLT